MYPGIGTSGGYQGQRPAQKGCKGLFHQLLYGNGIGLPLPAMVGLSKIGETDKKSQGNVLF
jgi:hypothetical protein